MQQILGILNVTPDSFSDGGHFLKLEQAIQQGISLQQQGADMIDVGGESTRPGAAPVSVQEELDRVIPVIEALTESLSIPVSIDTSKPEVMQAAVAAGATLINDVRALTEPGALKAAAQSNAKICLMHMQNQPDTMQANPNYTDVVADVKDYLSSRIEACLDVGISQDRLIIDPGFGFGKNLEHNLALLKHLKDLTSLGCPIMVGLSRKSMFGQLYQLEINQRETISVVAALISAAKGASILRVHDVAQTKMALSLMNRVVQPEEMMGD